jgi:hypothetical protein
MVTIVEILRLAVRHFSAYYVLGRGAVVPGSPPPTSHSSPRGASDAADADDAATAAVSTVVVKGRSGSAVCGPGREGGSSGGMHASYV